MANFGFSRLSVSRPLRLRGARRGRLWTPGRAAKRCGISYSWRGCLGTTLWWARKPQYRKPEQRVVPLRSWLLLVNQELARGGRVHWSSPEKHGLTRMTIVCHCWWRSDGPRPAFDEPGSCGGLPLRAGRAEPVADSTGAAGKMDRDSSRFPQGLKPALILGLYGTTEVVPDTDCRCGAK